MRNADIMQIIQRRLEKNNVLSQRIYEKVDRLVTNMNTHIAPKRPTRQHIPSKPKVFLGRDVLVQEIAELLCEEETSRVCIVGPGGMGKTSLALAIVESPLVQSRYSESSRFWVPCVEAVSPAIFLQLLHVQLKISRATDDTLEDILAELNISSEPRLILLDNFETPWISVEDIRHQVNNIIGRLAKVRHVALLMTMRGTEPPCDDVVWQSKNLHPVDKEAARSIFQEIYPKSKQDPGVDSLVAVLGYLPFAVILMAKLGKKSWSSTSDLLREWSLVGTMMISSSSSPNENMNRSIMLSVHKDFVQQNPDACLLLTTLSLLPAGTSRANLRCWIPNLQSTSSAIATLADAALLMMDDGGTPETSTLYVLPVVQSYMSTTNQIPNDVRMHVQEACCRYLFDHGYRYYEPAFEQHSEALAGEDTNIRVILLTLTSQPSSITERQIEALLRLAWYHLDTSRPSLEIAQRTMDVAKSSGKDRYIAEALLILGDTYHQISKYELAEQSLMEAYKLFNTVAETHDVAMLITQCGICLADTGMALLWPSESIVSFIRTLQSRFSVSLDDFHRACVLRALGYSLYCDDQCNEGMGLLHEAKAAFMQMGQLVDAAHSMLFIARSYQWTSAARNASKSQRTSNIENALKSIEEACKIMKLVKDQILHAEIDLCHGQILMGLGRHSEALIKFDKSLSTFRYLNAISQVAITLECFGYIHMCRGDYRNACAAYEAALEQYREMDQESSWGETVIRRCRTNLIRIKSKEEDPQEDISLLEPPM